MSHDELVAALNKLKSGENAHCPLCTKLMMPTHRHYCYSRNAQGYGHRFCYAVTRWQRFLNWLRIETQ